MLAKQLAHIEFQSVTWTVTRILKTVTQASWPHHKVWLD
jgi:hypothetical protein